MLPFLSQGYFRATGLFVAMPPRENRNPGYVFSGGIKNNKAKSPGIFRGAVISNCRERDLPVEFHSACWMEMVCSLKIGGSWKITVSRISI